MVVEKRDYLLERCCNVLPLALKNGSVRLSEDGGTVVFGEYDFCMDYCFHCGKELSFVRVI